MVRDPVCGRFISREEAIRSADHGRERYYFCSAVCSDAFAAEPVRFLQRALELPEAR